ncbi:23S rRNA pseudouridine2605 synthase [Aquimonas voraii]|uniref:Pseudouridine synthase n=2 Tax=Aquimonas voraii TaxID=265719 RepID=A0A1G6YXR2_9GAMM|nr:23S rRNA pseudouridine2605 synthase [Aquimonas voraii]
MQTLCHCAMSVQPPRSPRYGLARVLSKRGLCSRSEAERWVRAGRVTVRGRVVTDPESPTALDEPRIVVDGGQAQSAERIYLALNKPRGLVTTARDERGRETVYRCLEGLGLPWVAPAGRLDQASEGLLVLSNDPAFNAALTEPRTPLHKTYRVQVEGQPAAGLLARLRSGIDDAGERLSAVSIELMRQGPRNAWLEVVLDEGRNRHIRRLLAAGGLPVLRLMRVAIGPLALGELAKGAVRRLAEEEVDALRRAAGAG